MRLYIGISMLLFQITSLLSQDAKEIVRLADQKMRANSNYSEITMKIIKPDWSREMRMKIWALEPDFALVLITEPARDKGTVTLKRKMEVWNYIPTVQRTIKVPPSMMLQPWMGSDFTNDDLVRQSSIVQDYQHRIVGEEAIDEKMCYKIEMIPKPEAGVVWGKLEMWITKNGYLQLKTNHYDEDSILVKTMKGSQIKTLGGREIPTYWEMIPFDKPDQKTVMIYHDIEFNIDINPDFFSLQNLKRIR